MTNQIVPSQEYPNKSRGGPIPVEQYVPSNSVNIYKYTASQQTNAEAKCYKNVTENITPAHDTESKTLQAQEKLSARILEWVKGSVGWWDTPELDKDLAILNSQDKNNRRIIIYRLKEQGIIEQHPTINKKYRYVNTKVATLDYKTASSAGILPVHWPLKIENYVNLYPGNMVVVAGSPNAGKTALLLDFIYLNQDQYPIYYFCSESGAPELKNRLEKFPDMDISKWKFTAKERSSDFADVIVPDAINIIDFLEITTDLWDVNTKLISISHRLGTGLAIVALQKKHGAPLGRGQEFGLEKPKLYLSMDKGLLRIIKGKSWANKTVNPNGLQITFKIIDGCLFKATSDWSYMK